MEVMFQGVWESCLLNTAKALSRTAKGVGDTSSSVDKPKLTVADGEALAKKVDQNLREAARLVWKLGRQIKITPAAVERFITEVATIVSQGLLQAGQSVFRKHDIRAKYPQMPLPENVEVEYRAFCRQLSTKLSQEDAVKVAAWAERELDWRIHPFADGCGRTAKLIGAWVLLRAELLPADFRDRIAYYRAMNSTYETWEQFYSNHVLYNP